MAVQIPSAISQKAFLEYADRLLVERNRFEDYYSKMEAIDEAYARYTANRTLDGVAYGEGIDAATTPVGVHNLPSTCPPVVVSQVDSMVAYLAEIFVGGYPLFPVVSSPKNKKQAEALETLLDDHSSLGGYPRQLLLFLLDAVKYNVAAIEADWTSIEQYSISDELLDPGVKKLNKDNKSYTKIERWDMYNTFWDRNVNPGDMAAKGDYAGNISVLSRTKLKRLLNRLSVDGECFNTKEALAVGPARQSAYRIHPQISDYVAARKPLTEMNWAAYLGASQKPYKNLSNSDNYELLTIYCRIVPADFGLNVPAPNTPQIWKLLIINQEVLIQAKRIISAYDYLPVLFGQPREDGFGYQTQSVAEGSIPYQEAAKTLFNIRFNAARRAVSDRALFDPLLISPNDINAPVPAAKIPVKSNSLDATRKIQDAYYQIPFDARGTETALQDGMTIVNFGKELSGLNSPMQGQFQKGNKSVTEWNDVMGNADSRLRMPAIVLEHQVFTPLKNILKLNIYQYGDDAEVVSQKTGEVVTVNVQELRQSVLSFRIADGYTPKSKLASTETIGAAMQMISQSQPLAQSFGYMLPDMFVHLMQLSGVRGLEEYVPETPQPTATDQKQQELALQQQQLEQQALQNQQQGQP